MKFGYFRGKKDREVDIIATVEGKDIPFEVKYTEMLDDRELQGFREFCDTKEVERGYVIVKSWRDFKVSYIGEKKTPVLQIPAPLALYLLGQSEGRSGEDS